MKGEIKIRTSKRLGIARATIDAHVFGVWAAHPVYQTAAPRSSLWSVTHIPSGRCLQSYGIPKIIAKKVAKTLAREVNLKTETAVRAHGAHVREIWRRCGALL